MQSHEHEMHTRTSSPDQQPATRQRFILQQTARYGLLVPEAVCGSTDTLTLGDAKRLMHILARRGQLIEAPLYRSRSCFYISRAGARALGDTNDSLPSLRHEPMSESVKIRAYAMLSVCCLGPRKRTKLTPVEIKQHFADLCCKGHAGDYYIDSNNGAARLGFLRVDMSDHGRWDRLVAKASDDARTFLVEPAVRQLIEQCSFELRIVTALPQKADRVGRALADTAEARRIPIHVTAIPELINLIAPLPTNDGI